MNKKKTILVIDDELVNRRILHRILERNYEVLEAGDGQEGWEYLMQNRTEIAAVLLDLVMPLMNGYQFLEKLRGAGITDLPVIVTTGVVDNESEEKALDAGAWDFVTKPYNARVLQGRLRNAIARSQVALYEQMQKMAAHDPLTGLHNRSRMFEQTRKMLDQHPDTTFAFMRFDIDHFALFNTSFGEEEGNRLLKYIASNLEKIAEAEPLCTYCRMNADIFCACLTYNGDPASLEEKVNFFQEKLAAYRSDYLLALSAGVYVVEDKNLSIDELYLRATIAARRCKNQYARHMAFYDAAVGQKMANEIAITNEMQTALDEEQFIVYLQPKFYVMTDSICGAEALVRWMHPVKGMIAPGEFISVFENNGFITKLDYYVWEKTCAMLHEWMEAGFPSYSVSLNISRVSLYNPHLPDLLTELVNRYQIAPELLQLEITESAYMSNPELMEMTIQSLHDAGFTILMDDFGSGYSSLNTLKQMHIDILKIDMKFLPIGDETERGEIILASIIKMATLLGISVVTEGVETRRQRDFLESAGCEAIQGFFYSRPIPRAEYEERYLKTAPADSGERSPEQGKEDQTRHDITVLVIDDSEEECELVRENLMDQYYVHTCDSAEAGLAYLKRNMNRVMLILIDNIMPGMTGMEFLKYCHMDNALKAIPKIMITASDTVEDQVKAFQAGAYDYIAKPLTREILLARVGHALALSNQISVFDTIRQDYNHVSERDVLTGLLNKTAFYELADRLVRSAPEEDNALMMLDIDDFKKINDAYGHLAGDNVLKCVAGELLGSLRKTDIIGRLGGDEFVVLMTRIPNHEAAKKKASEIIKAVVFRCASQLNIDASISIGIAFSGDGDRKKTLFTRAEQALCEAKSSGKATALVYGERILPVENDDKPIVLICSEGSWLYPAIALAYGEEAAFINITSYEKLVQAFTVYQDRIRTICMDMQKKSHHDSEEFYQYILSRGGGEQIPILAFCEEGNMQQMREALELKIMDVLPMSPHIDMIQQRLTTAIRKAEALGRGKEEEAPCPGTMQI